MGCDADAPRLAILAFHKIGPPPKGEYATWNYIPESTFVGFLEDLAEDDWTVVDLGRFMRGISDPRTLPRKAALLTFDDGYRSMVTVTLPILRRFGHPAVLFVPTAFVGGYNSFDEGMEPKEEICSWEDLRTLEQANVAVQSHGVHHHRFSELSEKRSVAELRDSKSALEGALGRSVETIAYPYGDNGRDPGNMARLAQSAGYRAAFLYQGTVIETRVSDAFAVPRLAMGPDSNLAALLS
jgi:peptidoglycan/xylan/chitin deacetylase (PgdA/CDA1 family)